jgi:vancomycin resistance protein YoaR
MAAVALTPLGLGAAGLIYLANLPPPEVRLAGFATRLEGRTGAQRHNAELSARSLDGAVIPPGKTFSFNGRVRSWSVDQGYVRAPVSYDGELVPAFGGGVCQTSTTLYNTALLAGMKVTERHHHAFAPHYVTPGRDAAVAYPNLDLRFTNPNPFPVRVRAEADGDRLSIELWGRRPPAYGYTLVSRVLSTAPPAQLLRRVSAVRGVPAFARSTGATGFRIVTYRAVTRNGTEVRRERLSDDSYPPMPRLIRYVD